MTRTQAAPSRPRLASDLRVPRKMALDVLSTPIGELRIVCSDKALCALDFADYQLRMLTLLERRYGAVEFVEEHDPLGVVSQLEHYFAGKVDALDAVSVEGGGTSYQTRVWSALRTIPAGTTWTYGELARFVGATHARAIGNANSLNPIAIVVPCHRVIGANTTLTGYAGGLHRKRWLLEHEAHHAGRSPMFTQFTELT